MRKFTKLMLTLALAFMAVGGVKAAKVYEIDYSTKTGFPYYVMGFVPEWVNGIMTDYGANYRYETQTTLEGDGDAKLKDGESSIGTVLTNNSTEYQKVTGAGPYWHQYFIADGIPTTVEGTYAGIYIVKAMVKASAACNIDVSMGWGWSSGQSKNANVTIPQSDDFVEVEWSYSGIEGNSCNLVAKPGTSTATIEWKSLAVYSYDDTKNHVLKVTNSAVKANIWDNSATYTFAEALTAGTKYTVTAKICAADVARGAIMKFVLGGTTPKYGGEKAILANTFTQVSETFTADTDNTNLEIDLGFVNGRVYIDDVSVVAEGSSTNLVSNGDFEEAFSTAGWSVPGYTGQTIGHTEQAQGVVALGARKVTIGTTGWATMIAPDFPVSVPAEIDAYYAKYDSEKGNVKLTAVENMPRYGCAVINGEPGDYYCPQIADGDVTANGADNGMKISWGSVTGDGSTIYVLANLNRGIGFYLMGNGQNVPSGKPYLQIPTSPTAPEFIGFGGETTGIGASLVNSEERIVNSVFNLAGQRVAQPTKGLYIVNGKKVVVK